MAPIGTSIDRVTDFGFASPNVYVAAVSAAAIVSGKEIGRAGAVQQAEHSQAVLEVPLTSLTPNSVPLAATVTVLAGSAGNTFLGDVAIVRAEGADPSASSKVHVVDLQGLRVVSGVDHPNGVTAVDRWQAPAFVPLNSTSTASFADVQTDRLRLTLATAAAPADVADQGTVVLLSPPADLQLSIGGTQIWTRPGPVRPTEADRVTFREDIVLDSRQVADLEAAVAAAPEGSPPVLVLRSSVPGRLRLEADIPHRQTLDLPFPEGPDRPVPFAAEGSVSVPLVIPAPASQVAVVRATLRAPEAGAARVLPPVGPDPSPAQVVLDRDRAVVVAIPGRSRAALAVLHAVRVHVAAGPSGAELGGFLRADVPAVAASAAPTVGATTPGELLPDASFGPVVLPPGSGEGAWVTLPLSQPRPLDSDGDLWVELRVSRGTVAWQLAQPVAGDSPDAAFDAVVRRALPSGEFQALSVASAGTTVGARSQVVPVPTGSGMLRVVGEPPPDRPIPILDLDVDFGRGVMPGLARSVTPTPDGMAVEIVLPALGTPLSLTLTAFAPLDLTVGRVSVEHL